MPTESLASFSSLMPRASLAAAISLFASCHMNPDTEPVRLPPSSSTAQTGTGTGMGTQHESGPSTAKTEPTKEDLVPLKNRLGLRGAYSNGDEDDAWTRDGIDLEVDFGHRLNGNLEVGAVVGIAGSDLEEIVDPDQYYAGPSGRFYFMDKGQLQPWASISAGIGKGGGGFVGDGFNSNFGSFGYYQEYSGEDFKFLRLGAGVSYFASTSVAVEAGLWYAIRERDDCFRYYPNLGGSEAIADQSYADTSLRIGISWFF